MRNTELKSLRSRLGLTQAALAEAVGVVPNTLARWERGELGIPGWAAERLDAAARSGSSGRAVSRPRGVVLDPHHRAIVEALNGALDPTVFEACAVDILKRDWPRIVPVAGGGDDGFDGAVADGGGQEPFPLIVTTAKDLTGNLRRSLRRAQRKRATLDRTLFATSRRVTPRMRQKLEAAAGELGVKLLQIYEQDWFAQRLYAEATWCQRLLQLTGRPRALSPFPVTQRPILGDRILGRERETRWLQERTGDCLLIGAPGSGKTFLLRAFVLQGQALFKVDDDREQIANDLRNLKPPAVIIDDAHVDPDEIVRFAQIREEVGSDVRIIATSWPGGAVAVRNALQIPSSEVLTLELIDADTMIEIIKSVGIGGPDNLLRMIRQQAAGRPGLAATLAHLCQEGDVRRVVSGDELVDQLVPQLDRLIGFSTQQLLAPFALGGNAGAPADTVAKVLGKSLIEISNDLAQLAAAGIVQESRTSILQTGDDGTPVMRTRVGVSVEPSPMRWVLVRRVFFGGVGSSPVDPFLEIVGSEADALDTLIGARSRGASIPDLAERLERADARLSVEDSSRLWAEYASLGPSEARDVIDRRPDRLLELAGDVLEQVPETAIPLLLDRVRKIEGSRPEDLLSEDPLDVLAKWATRLSPTREDWFYRRSALSRAADHWRRGGGDARTALRAMCIALNPKSEFTTTDPGRGQTVHLHFGTLGHRHVEDLIELWQPTLGVLSGLDDSETPWHDLLSLVAGWVHYPFDPLLGIPDEVRSDVLTFANRMIQDLADLSRQHAGLQHELKATAELAGLKIDVTLDPEFEALHQHLELDEEIEMMRHGPLDSIVESWECRPVEEITRTLARIESEANLAGISYPRWSPYLCGRLAQHVRDPGAVAERFMEHGLAADLVGPFVLRAAKAAQPQFEALVRRCIDDERLRGLGLYATATHPAPPPGLLSIVLDAAGDYAREVDTWCLREEVPPATLLQMFCAADARLAVAAAIGHWCGRAIGRAGDEAKKTCSYCGAEVAAEAAVCCMCLHVLNMEEYKKLHFADGGIEDGRRLYDSWRQAILRAPADEAHISQHDEYWLGQILSKNRRLAEEWLVSKFGRRDGDDASWKVEGIAVKLVSVLDAPQRASVLAELRSDCHAEKLVKGLVAADVDLYRELLERRELAKYHLAPLAGKPCETWRRMALLALGKGYSVEDIVYATLGRSHSWSGPVSEMWAERERAFETLLSDVDRRIVRIGERGAEITGERKRRELEIEHYREVHGG